MKVYSVGHFLQHDKNVGFFDDKGLVLFKSSFVFGSSSVNVGFLGSVGFDFFIDASVMD